MDEKIVLSNGVAIPKIGYGTGVIQYPISYFLNFFNGNCFVEDAKTRKLLRKVMKEKNIMIDTAESYEYSEKDIGKVMKKLKREDVFLVSKVSNKSQYNGSVELALEKTLKNMNIDYVDLYLLHWPVEGCYLKSWKVLEQLYLKKKCRAIGVANFNVHHMKELMDNAKIVPMVNQIECHPLFTQNELRQFCNSNDIRVMAYTPTARMDKRMNITVLTDISKKYKKSIAQIILRWHLQLGNIPVVNTNNPKHFKEDFDVFGFRLTDEEVRKITDININSRLRFDPDNCDFSKL